MDHIPQRDPNQNQGLNSGKETLPHPASYPLLRQNLLRPAPPTPADLCPGGKAALSKEGDFTIKPPLRGRDKNALYNCKTVKRCKDYLRRSPEDFLLVGFGVTQRREKLTTESGLTGCGPEEQQGPPARAWTHCSSSSDKAKEGPSLVAWATDTTDQTKKIKKST